MELLLFPILSLVAWYYVELCSVIFKGKYARGMRLEGER